ncbi:MAG: efflux RND transporter permease subunit, partial [Bacteroidota bacterium]
MGIRDSMFVGLSVPLSSMIAFVVLPWIGFTLNLVVLFTFIFALGIVVDNAIVVIENTYRIYNKERVPLVMAAKKAAGEVIAPVFAGTLTTMAPFLPLAFWEGIIGEFMFYMPITIIITLFASLLVAYVINPVFAVTFMRRDDESKGLSMKGFVIIMVAIALFSALFHMSEQPVPGNILLIFGLLFALYRFVLKPAISGFQNRVLPWLMGIYRNVLDWSLRRWHPYAILGGTVLTLFFSFGFFGANPPKVVFFPEADPNFMYIYTQMPMGTSIEKTNEVTKDLENIVYDVLGKDNPAVKSVITNVAKGAGSPQDFNQSGVFPHKSRIQVEFVPFKQRNGFSTAQVLKDVRLRVQDIPGATITVEKEASGPPTAKPVNIEVKGEDFFEIQEIATSLKNYLDSLVNAGTIVGVEELKWDVEVDKPELAIDVDHTKASELGMNVAQIGMAIRTAVFGSEVSKFRTGEDEYPIVVRIAEPYRNDVDALQDMNLNYMDMATASFLNVPIRSVAKVRDTISFGGINRLDLKKVITIYSNVLTEYNPNEVVFDVIDWMEEWKSKNESKLRNATVEMTGELEEQAETGAFLGMAMAASMLLIFLILVAQFNSLIKVSIIFSQIIFSITGVLLGFAATGMDMSIVMVGVGVVSLAGIVVNNGIILLDFIDLQKKRGYTFRDAIIEGGATRFTPVILTASSTVIGLIPLALALNINFGTLFSDLDPQIFFGGDTAVFWGPLSWTIIYGLGFATIVTLVVVPVMYYIFTTNTLVLRRKIAKVRRRIGNFLS